MFVRSPMLMKLAVRPLVAAIASGGHERLEAGEAQRRSELGHGTRRQVAHGVRDLADVGGCRAAAATDDVYKASLCPSPDVPAGPRRALVVFAELVRQAGVGVGGDEGVGHRGQLG